MKGLTLEHESQLPACADTFHDYMKKRPLPGRSLSSANRLVVHDGDATFDLLRRRILPAAEATKCVEEPLLSGSLILDLR